MARRGTTLKPFIAGNWKMNGRVKDVAELVRLIGYLKRDKPRCDVLVCPPSTLIHAFRVRLKGSPLQLGGQDCHGEANGAHTGDISAAMLKDAGAKWVIVGHSERRRDHGESDAVIHEKARAALAAGLGVIVCIGETEAERDAGKTLSVVGAQLAGSLPEEAPARRLVVAYEPVWAIGTGRTPSLADIGEVHRFLRRRLEIARGDEGTKVRLLYGGSVKPSNAREILAVPDVDGSLVGGASLKARDFYDIIRACPK